MAALVACLALSQVREQPKSFDSKAKLYRLSAEANSAAATFPEPPGFDHREMWQTAEGPVLEAYQTDKNKERTSITEEELAHVRQQVDAYLMRRQPAKLNQEGRRTSSCSRFHWPLARTARRSWR